METTSVPAERWQAFALGLLNLAIEAGWRWDQDEKRWIQPGTPEHAAGRGEQWGCAGVVTADPTR